MANQKNIKRKYILKEGHHQMRPGGSTYTNETLTDEQAAAFIKENSNLKVLFLKLPK